MQEDRLNERLPFGSRGGAVIDHQMRFMSHALCLAPRSAYLDHPFTHRAG